MRNEFALLINSSTRISNWTACCFIGWSESFQAHEGYGTTTFTGRLLWYGSYTACSSIVLGSLICTVLYILCAVLMCTVCSSAVHGTVPYCATFGLCVPYFACSSIVHVSLVSLLCTILLAFSIPASVGDQKPCWSYIQDREHGVHPVSCPWCQLPLLGPPHSQETCENREICVRHC